MINPLDNTFYDYSANPLNNFYQYCNGGWLADPKELDPPRLIERQVKQGILQIFNDPAMESSILSDFYNADKSDGLEYFRSQLDSISKIDTVQHFYDMQSELGANAVYILTVSPDYEQHLNVLHLVPHGGSLRRLKYYEDQKIVTKYKEYLINLFQLMGDKATSDDIERIIKFESNIVEARSAKPNTVLLSIKELVSMAPRFPIESILKSIKVDASHIMVDNPDYFFILGQLISETEPYVLQLYLKSVFIGDCAIWLSKDIHDLYYGFFGEHLYGSRRKSRMDHATNIALQAFPDIVSKWYTDNYFTLEAKEHAESVLRYITDELKKQTSTFDWINSVTKSKVLAKLETLKVQVGFKDSWDNYSDLASLINSSNQFVENMNILEKHQLKRTFAKLNKPIGVDEWLMPPYMTFVMYNPKWNVICIPAGILQPPYFYPGYPALTFGMFINRNNGDGQTCLESEIGELDPMYFGLLVAFSAFKNFIKTGKEVEHSKYTLDQQFFTAFASSQRGLNKEIEIKVNK
ncbi:hypothetical protein HDV04_005432, partial [Boothiomyces sp. JEL0838]